MVTVQETEHGRQYQMVWGRGRRVGCDGDLEEKEGHRRPLSSESAHGW